MQKPFVCSVFLLFAIEQVSGQVNVLTANYNLDRNNANVSETTLTPALVSSGNFGLLGTFPVDGQIYAQPLYVSGLNIDGAGTHNVVFVVTMHNGIYAIDADSPGSSTPLWYVNLGPSVPSNALLLYDINPELGILGTPVIDLTRGVMYLVAATWEQTTAVYTLHALNLANGQETLGGPTLIRASVQGASGNAVLLNPNQHLQRPGLLLLNDRIYIGFGSHNDASPYHGWLMSYDASNIQTQLAVFNTTPNANGGAVWQAGRAPMVDSAGNIYVVTGNGDYDGSTAFGESFLKLSGDLQMLDWFTPYNWKTLSDADQDLGSTGAIMVPGGNLVLAGNKYGTIYVVSTSSMGNLANPGDTPQNFQPVRWGGVFNLALWPTANGARVYVLEQGSIVRGFQMTNGLFDASPFAEGATSFDIPYDGIAISSNGTDLTTGILWMTTGNHSLVPVPGTLHAYNANTLQELWNSDMLPSRDYLGLFTKFVAPTVANGQVFVPTFSHQLDIYGMLTAGGTTSNAPQITAVLNSASYAGASVSPGELVTIFGANLGPKTLVNGLDDPYGLLQVSVAGVQVLFDNAPSPLVYVSENQLSAIAPFGMAGQSATVAVVSGAHTSNQVTIPVTPASPGIFSLDGSGKGQVIAANQDWTLNSATNPAAKGSVIVLYATGGGQTKPAGQDGVTTGSTPPTLLELVTAQIDGQDAAVQYAGAAPGAVAGVIQINVMVPPGARSGAADSIVLTIGGQSQPSWRYRSGTVADHFGCWTETACAPARCARRTKVLSKEIKLAPDGLLVRCIASASSTPWSASARAAATRIRPPRAH